METSDYCKKLKIFPVECDCDFCRIMCHAPCIGSVEDLEKIIDAGFADRLCFDDLPSIIDAGDFLKPALKGNEGGRSEWNTSSDEGCTFWKNGKCELHDKNLKPILGQLSHHTRRVNIHKYAKISKKDWESDRGKALISRWKKLVDYQEPIAGNN